MESLVNMVPGMFPVCVSRSRRWRSPSTPSSKDAGNLLHRHQVRQQTGQDDGGAPRAGDLSPGEGMMEELHGQKNQSMVDMNNVAVPEERSRVLGAEQRRRALGEEHRGAGRWERTQRRWALSSWVRAVGAGS